MKINSYKQNDIRRIVKIYIELGNIIHRAAVVHPEGKYVEWLLSEMPEFIEKYPFTLMLEDQREKIKQQLQKINIQVGIYGEAESQSIQGNSASPYVFNGSHRDNTKYIIIHSMWCIYEQFLLASIHPTTAELFVFCGMEVNQNELDNILEWYKVTAAKYGFKSQHDKATRVRARKKWSEQAKARHSVLMTEINKNKAKKQN